MLHIRSTLDNHFHVFHSSSHLQLVLDNYKDYFLRCHITTIFIFYLLKPTGYVMHQQVLTFNNCTLCLHCIYVFCVFLRTDSDLCHLQHKLIGIYNRDEKCLQRGTDWVFKLSSLCFVFKGLRTHNFRRQIACVCRYVPQFWRSYLRSP